jgi:hypothetical protein
LEVEYPAVRALYNLLDAADRVRAVRMTAEHNYNKDSREAMYAWMARWLKHAPEDVRPSERSFTPEPVSSLLVFHQRALPPNAVDVAGLTAEWIEAAKRQVTGGEASAFRRTLRHVLGFVGEADAAVMPPNRTVLLGAANPELERELMKKGLGVKVIRFTPFDAAAAGKIRHFETYNRTAASQRVADIVSAVRAYPGAAVVADGDAALAAILAAAVAPVRLAILDVDQFDTSSDTDFVDHLYIPGLRRAGDLRTAVSMSRGEIVVHNAGPKFDVTGLRAQAAKLTPADIAARVRQAVSRR